MSEKENENTTPEFYPLELDPELSRIAETDTELLSKLESLRDAHSLADREPENPTLARVALFAEESVQFYLENKGYGRTIKPPEE